MFRKYIFILIGLLQAQALFAQEPDIVFNHITEKDGLSYNIVNCFLKDRKGILWIGTYNGLNRYDGKHFYTYHKGAAKNTMPHNTVHKLIEDRDGNIWGGTDLGAFCLNTITGQFKRYGTPMQDEWPAVLNLCLDKEGKVWAVNDFRLSYYDPKSDQFVEAPVKGIYPEGMIRKNGFIENPDGKGFWVATVNGLQYYNKQAQQLTTADNSKDSALFNHHSIAALCATKYGHYWLADNNAATVKAFDPLTGQIKYNIDFKPYGTILDGATLFEDSNHMLWFSTWNYELYMIDYLHGNKITRVRYNKNDANSIAGDFFWAVMEESDGTLWFGTVGGISRCNLPGSFFRIHQLTNGIAENENQRIDFFTENIFNKSWWYSTKEKLVQYNPSSGSSISWPFSQFKPNALQKKPRKITGLIFLKDSILLFDKNGIWFKKGNQNFFPVNTANADLQINAAILSKENKVYAINDRQLIIWDLNRNRIDSVASPASLTANGKSLNLEKLLILSDTVWIITRQGKLLCYNQQKELKIVALNYRNESDLVDGYFRGMTKDKNGNIWIAKKGEGLICFNPKTGKGKLLNQQNGLVMDHAMSVAEDRTGKIWSGCYNQFSVYNPASNSFYNLTLPISVNNYDYINKLLTLSNGNILGNVGATLVEFFPGRLKAAQVKEKPLISMFSINGNDTSLYYNSSITLKPDENSFHIRFGMLTDIKSSPYSMLYILEGAEKNWTESANSFEAGYNSLPSGKYIFRVKAIAKDKSWQTEEAILNVEITMPFYKTWWFLLLMGLAAFSIVVLIYRFRLAQQERVMLLENKAQLLEKEKTVVMYESLKQQLNPHFLFNSLTSLSGLIETNQQLAGSFLEQMSGIYRYILKNGDKETVTIKDEIEFVKLYINLQQTRFKKGLQVNINVPEELLHAKIAPVTLQNMIENAIKHNIIDIDTPLVIDIYTEHDYVCVRNNLQKKNMVETSNKKGLMKFETLYRYLSERPIIIEETSGYFNIKIPLI